MSFEGAIAVTRFGLGARDGEIDAANPSPKTWLLSQLESGNEKHATFEGLLSSTKIYEVAKAYRRERKAMTGDAKTSASKKFGQSVQNNFQAEIKARAAYAAQTEAPFHERLTRFWSNHFSVSARNRNTRLFAGAYEREAIRPHILGSFFELANEAIFHPGMLSFLDNVSSIGPGSRAGQRQGKGLNENLAREVLELHTVTPAASYTQADVTEFAKSLTGWTIGKKERDGGKVGKTMFNRRWHEPGTRIILGKPYSQPGKMQARAILKDIYMRPETAENVSRKLARHFVSDTPPEALVQRLKASFLKTQGDLKALYKTLIESPEVWATDAQKVKTPEDLLISTARVIGIEKVFPRRPRDTYESLAQTPFGAPTPEGWPDKAEAWMGPDAMMKRIEWANDLASRLPSLDARKFLQSALGPLVSKDTLQAVARAESGHQALVLAFMSPDFQRR